MPASRLAMASSGRVGFRSVAGAGHTDMEISAHDGAPPNGLSAFLLLKCRQQGGTPRDAPPGFRATWTHHNRL